MSHSDGTDRTIRAKRLWLLCGAFCLAAAAGPAQGQLARPANTGAPAASVPDFTGIWGKRNYGYEPPYTKRSGDTFTVVGGMDSPFLKPWTAQIVTEKAGYTKAGKVMPADEITCWPNGVPGIFNFRHIQILQTPTQMTILYKNNNQSRTIYLNQKHSAKVVAGWYGESVGRFEGDTLVVDTVGFRRRPQAWVDDYGTPVTEGLHVVERYRLIHGPTADEPPPPVYPTDFPNRWVLDMQGKGVQLTYTVEDPNTFKKPWTGTLYFRQIAGPPESAEMDESICPENNRDWAALVPTADAPDF